MATEYTSGVSPKKLSNAMSVLDEVVGEFAARKLAEMGTEEMRESISKQIYTELMEQYGEVKRVVKVTPDVGEEVHIEGVMHAMFDTVLGFVRNNEPVYLAGEAGSGKSVICEQIARVMGLDFYYSSSVTQEYKITGFTDANGHYNESPFYQAFTKGGIFMLDELDASIPEVLILLNGAIANKKFDFPAPIGNVSAHPDFRIVQAGNTVCGGASYTYNGRNQLDGATMDRFAIVPIDYDLRIEQAMARGNEELLDFIHDIRKTAKDVGANIIVSYRAIRRMQAMEEPLGTSMMMNTCLVRGMDKDTMKNIYEQLANKSNKYAKAFKGLME